MFKDNINVHLQSDNLIPQTSHFPTLQKYKWYFIIKTSIGPNLMNLRTVESGSSSQPQKITPKFFSLLIENPNWSKLTWFWNLLAMLPTKMPKCWKPWESRKAILPVKNRPMKPNWIYLHRLCGQNNLLPGTMRRPRIRVFKQLLLVLLLLLLLLLLQIFCRMLQAMVLILLLPLLPLLVVMKLLLQCNFKLLAGRSELPAGSPSKVFD